MRFKRYILKPGNITEAVYSGNIGFEELTQFYYYASDKEKKQLEVILKNEDWEKFKELIKRVTNINIKPY